MTLIASIEVDYDPILLGDFLISVDAKGLNIPIQTPLVENPNSLVDLANSKGTLTGVRQKVAIIHDHICFAWTGTLSYAEKFADHLRNFSTGKATIDYQELKSCIDVYPTEDIKEKISFVIYSFHGTFAYFSNLAAFDLDELSGFNRLRIGGSGSEHFFKNIQHAAAQMAPGTLPHRYHEAAGSMLLYACMAASEQLFSNEGLADRWGGGFEIVIFEQGKFVKLGPILWLFWDITPTGNPGDLTFKMTLRPRFLYQYYNGSSALFWSDDGTKSNTQLITPPFNDQDPPIVPPSSMNAAYVVSLLHATEPGGISRIGAMVIVSQDVNEKAFIDRKEDGSLQFGMSDKYLRKIILDQLKLPSGSAMTVEAWGKSQIFDVA